MTKQEEIREGIEKVICSCCDDVEDWEAGQTLTEAQEHCHKMAICAYCTGLRDALLEYEDSQGVVMLKDMGNDMAIKDNYVAVVSIKE